MCPCRLPILPPFFVRSPVCPCALISQPLYMNASCLFNENISSSPSWVLSRKGYDSIVARGKQEPDPSLDITVSMDGKLVTVPQGRAKAMQGYERSKFYNSEYLVRTHDTLAEGRQCPNLGCSFLS